MAGTSPAMTKNARARALRRDVVREDRLDLGLQRRRVERLDDVVVHAGLLGGDDVLGLGFGGDHDERRGRQSWVGAHRLEQVEAGHRLHVPVGNDQAIFAFAQFVQCRRSIIGVVDILEAKLAKQMANDANHRVGGANDQNRYRQVDRHNLFPRRQIPLH